VVLELAHVTVLPGHQTEFEVALAEAVESVLPRAAGFVDFTGHGWCIERPSVYLFTITWEALEDHTEGFRGSADYEEWKQLLHHFYDPFPTVLHYERVPL